MPEVPQYNWSKLKPPTLKTGIQAEIGTQSLPTYRIQAPPKGSKHGSVKSTIPPKHKRAKLIDKRLINDNYDNQQHLRQISLED